jgi:glycosyltransferase involved in cell wall biosynthesis
MAKLSILLASKNQSKFIPELLSSLYSQSSQDFELIVVDSFSSDDSVNLFRSFNKAKIFSRECSADDAYAFALTKAKGKYIALMTTSDYLYSPKWIENSIKTLDRDENISLVWGSAIYINESGVIKGIWGEHHLHKSPPNDFKYFNYWFFNPYLPELNYVVRKDVYKYCYKNKPNLDFLFVFLFNFTKYGFLPFYIPDLAHAGRTHSNSLTKKKRLNDFNQYYLSLRMYQFKYFFNVLFCFEKHFFRNGKLKIIGELKPVNRVLMPFIISVIFLIEAPKAFFRKCSNYFLLKLH